MGEDQINQAISRYVEANIAPKLPERKYISGKYTELRGAIGWQCFRSGSYPRLTANSPVHDLDVIYVVEDPALQDDPMAFIGDLKKQIENSSITHLVKVESQTHSLTLYFSDNDMGFSIDVVPVIESNDLNEFGDPIYVVPEILELNKHNREMLYRTTQQPVEWIRSDPRGYIKIAHATNKLNPNFRLAVKLGKAWRHACKIVYKDEFRFKSFHFEQIFTEYFHDNPGATIAEAATDCIGRIPTAIGKPQYRDRADASRYVDDYVGGLTDVQKNLILQLQSRAHDVMTKLSGVGTEAEVVGLLTALIDVKKEETLRATPAAAATVQPHRLWSE